MKFKIALPIIVALIVILGTTGIVLASYVIDRNIVATVIDPVVITPDQDVPITVYRGASTQVPYTIWNNTASPVTISVDCDGPPPGMSISCSPDEPFTLAPDGRQVVTATIFADTGSSNCTITLHFRTS